VLDSGRRTDEIRAAPGDAPSRSGGSAGSATENDMTTEPAIATAGLTKHFPGVPALSDLTIDVPAGSVYGFLGPNGAGKSTTIRILAGLSQPTSGDASVAGIPIEAGEEYRRHVGYLAQEPRFYDWMTGRETLRFVAGLYPAGRRASAADVDAILGRVGLADAADRRTGTYSGGMRQRLGIAQALVGRPDVLLLDEPVSALDPIGRREVLDLMDQLRGETTVFYSTHILEDVQRVSDHVAILDGGRLVRAAPTRELLTSFSQDRLQVALGGADDSTAVALASLEGVGGVEPTERDGDLRTYVLRVAPETAAAVQHRITTFAAERGLIVAENRIVRLGLEDVFLRLVNAKERAA
jgi:ABC-2 type transport system ATP-binding protein